MMSSVLVGTLLRPDDFPVFFPGALANRSVRNPQSTPQIAGHPIHPMLIPFPITFFVATFVADLVYWQTGSPYRPNASTWMLGAGLVMAALAAVAGLTDVLGDDRVLNL